MSIPKQTFPRCLTCPLGPSIGFIPPPLLFSQQGTTSKGPGPNVSRVRALSRVCEGEGQTRLIGPTLSDRPLERASVGGSGGGAENRGSWSFATLCKSQGEGPRTGCMSGHRARGLRDKTRVAPWRTFDRVRPGIMMRARQNAWRHETTIQALSQSLGVRVDHRIDERESTRPLSRQEWRKTP